MVVEQRERYGAMLRHVILLSNEAERCCGGSVELFTKAAHRSSGVVDESS